MAKKQRRTKQAQEFNDKPAYAADFLELRNPARPSGTDSQRKSGNGQAESGEAASQLRDRLDGRTMQQLTELKAKVKAQEEEQAQSAQGKSGKSGLRGSGKPGMANELSARRDGLDGTKDSQVDKDKSFKELFDPEPETEESFSDLFKDSKLDWRSYK